MTLRKALEVVAFATAMLCASCGPQIDAPPPPDATPADVASYIASENACTALRHHHAEDREEMRDLDRDRSQVCDHLDRDLADLRRSYVNDARTMRMLATHAGSTDGR